jgi:hypothetical protein
MKISAEAANRNRVLLNTLQQSWKQQAIAEEVANNKIFEDYFVFTPTQFQQLTELIAATEREKCAKLFDIRDNGIGFYEPHEPAEIIRARGQE